MVMFELCIDNHRDSGPVVTHRFDEMHIAISPVLPGGEEKLFEGVDLRALGYECVEYVPPEEATHVVLRHKSCKKFRQEGN